MQQTALKEYNAIAVFPDGEKARAAIEALGMAGVNGEDISLLGRAARAAEAETAIDTQPADARATQHIGKRTATGAVVGGGSGALVGALAGAAAIAIPVVGPAIGAGIWLAAGAGALNGALVGTTLGGLLAGESALSATEAWDRTFESISAGHVLVGVHTSDAKTLEKAVGVLQNAGPLRIVRFDSNGNAVPMKGGY